MKILNFPHNKEGNGIYKTIEYIFKFCKSNNLPEPKSFTLDRYSIKKLGKYFRTYNSTWEARISNSYLSMYDNVPIFCDEELMTQSDSIIVMWDTNIGG